MKKSFLFIFSMLILQSAVILAQPTGYYNGTEGKTGEELKAALNDIISGHTAYSYFYSKEIFKLSDADPNNPANVIEIYTGRSHLNTDYGSGPDQLNREHVWAKSHGNFEGKQPMDGDVHNLKPVDASVNTDKSNLDYDNGGTQHPEATGCYFSANNWEPRDEDKGDVARIIFYMDTRYEGENGELDLTVVDELNTYPYPEHGKLSTLLEWNMMDPPDDFERNRNNVIYSYQKNRNPFIDDPYLAELIWNNGTLNTVVIGDVQHSPEVPVAGSPISISATITSLESDIADVTLFWGTSWSNLNQNVDMDVEGGTYFADLPGQAQGTTVYFMIEAQDDDNTNSTVIYNFFVPRTFTGTLTSIYDIQGQDAASPLEGEVVSTTGIVTANFGLGYFIQDGTGPWNGLYIYDPGRNPGIGDSLVLTGTIDEYYEKTEMKTITGYYYISGGYALPAPVNINCIEAVEPYEGVLITVDNATCTDPNYQANYYMWTVNDGTGDLLVHNTSVFEYEPTEGEVYIVSGPLDYDFDEWKIQLRLGTDVLAGADITAPQVNSAEVITPTVIKLQFSEELEEVSAETLTNYSINNGITVEQANLHSIIKSQVFLTVSALAGGSYELTVQGVADLVGNVMPATVVPFTSTGVDDPLTNSNLSVYPNPSNGLFTLQWKDRLNEELQVRLITVTGQQVWSGRFHSASTFNLTVDAAGIEAGVYFVEVISENLISRQKLIIR